jgi:hypothetical protein
MKMKHQTTLQLPVELIFEVWGEEIIDGVVWPEELNISKVLLTVVGPGGKPRQIDIKAGLSESDILLLEDTIYEDHE